MSFRRIPKEIDPRRPPKRRQDDDDDSAATSKPRSYGQYVEMTPEDVAELERTTGEVAREGESIADETEGAASISKVRSVDEREAFEDATDEVSRENNDSRR